MKYYCDEDSLFSVLGGYGLRVDSIDQEFSVDNRDPLVTMVMSATSLNVLVKVNTVLETERNRTILHEKHPALAKAYADYQMLERLYTTGD